ncbi:hypothetical protein [Leclercia adecarboxylata]|uniref:hypothetical protein n=1 Tax=Leclercia adecarboxylata TaxID=83655 RepID=UPI003709DDA7
MSSREEFEAWASKQKLGLNYGDCGYVFSSTEMAWRAWQAMEAKCAALAAENAALKNYLAPIGLKIEGTPATDAYLAEVRASTADEACLKISNAIVNCYQDEQIGLDAAATICGDFAAQLRQEAAQ